MLETNLRRLPGLLGALALLGAAGLQARRRRGEEAHGAHGGHAEEEGLPAQSVTRWTSKAELFMEYEPPVAGREGKFAAHLTSIADLQAGDRGQMTLTIKTADGAPLDRGGRTVPRAPASSAP